MLKDWVESLPPNIKYAADDAGNPKIHTLCLIAFFVYYSATINLHRPLIPYPKEVHLTSEASLTKCVSATHKSIIFQDFRNTLNIIPGACIRIGDMVKSVGN
ncbi:hypothetical protein DFS33DRAFT_480441 [Desarmillaria ectypa]|nr:hypothetical protein DFS33DRAFT_480441 [Desarmillaria ectypa]